MAPGLHVFRSGWGTQAFALRRAAVPGVLAALHGALHAYFIDLVLMGLLPETGRIHAYVQSAPPFAVHATWLFGTTIAR